MSRIAFFCIPAFGHTNPTIGVVRELVKRGHEVVYYSFEPFREKIERAGAEFVACDAYQEFIDVKPEDAARVGKDIGFSIKILVEAILSMDEMVCRSIEENRPDCIVADSMAAWGKFAALKYHIPFVSSTTTFAFNQYSAKVMKQDISQLFSMLFAMPGIKKQIKRLQAKGYPVKNMLSIISNDNDTNTIVYTSPEFQPCSETFSDKYSFVGPSVLQAKPQPKKSEKKQIYISLGTVNNVMPDFYQNCIQAFKDAPYEVILSVGKETDVEKLGDIPDNIEVSQYVSQIAVLQSTDVFLSHCGMNSVNESLYYRVPLVLFPQTAEQGGVANRVAQLGAGRFLSQNTPEAIREAVEAVLGDKGYKENAERIAEGFRRAGGPSKAADAVLKAIAQQ